MNTYQRTIATVWLTTLCTTIYAQDPILLKKNQTVPTPSQGLDMASFVQHTGGKIIGRRQLVAGDLIAWLVEKSEKQFLLFTTTDEEAFITNGKVWNARSGEKISDGLFSRPSTPLTDKSSISIRDVLIKRYNVKVLERRPLGLAKLVGWLVEKDGKRGIFYSTNDNAIIFTGTVWEKRTGKNISDNLFGKSLSSNTGVPTSETVMAESGTLKGFAMEGNYTGKVPPIINTLASLSGVKEGNGSPANTVYIFFDPRCGYCKKTFKVTRRHVNNGSSIKWIPVAVLDNPANALPFASAILQNPNIDILRRILERHEPIKATPSPKDLSALQQNLDFMMTKFHEAHSEAAVPVAFFLDHRVGKLSILTGVTTPAIAEEIFGKI